MCICVCMYDMCVYVCVSYRSTTGLVVGTTVARRANERGGELGSSTIFKNLMSPTPRRKWYLTTGRRAHKMVLDPIPQPLPVHFFGSRPQPPTSQMNITMHEFCCTCVYVCMCVCVYVYVCVYVCVCHTRIQSVSLLAPQ